jgi:tetratricopeptide (TPR) repeat protein
MSAGHGNLQFTFRSLSPGYLGLSVFKGTLNARFFDRLFSETDGFERLGTKPILFPQRVPRTGFFDELKVCEIPAFADQFKEIQTRLIGKLHDFSRRRVLSGEDHDEYLNYLDLAARYGLLTEVAGLEFGNISPDFADTFQFEKLTYEISLAVSRDEIPEYEKLFAFLSALNASKYSGTCFKAAVMNRIIVAATRYCKTADLKDRLKELASDLLSFLNTFKPESFGEMVSVAMMWRGLPMAPGISREKQFEYLNRSIETIGGLKPADDLQALVRDELELTTRQSLAKFYLADGDIEGGLVQLRKMTELDPLDSTAFSEMGLLYFKDEKHLEEALMAFSIAARLGPPGLALNLFFKGECEKKLGLLNQAVESFHSCAAVDETALSPWLSLHEIHHLNGQIEEAAQVRNRILENPDLLSQITEDERKALGA